MTGERTPVEVDKPQGDYPTEGIRLEGERTHVEVNKPQGDYPSEGTRLAGERTSVKHDKKSVYDDYEDYVFAQPRKKKYTSESRDADSSHHHSNSHHHSSSHHRRHHHKKKRMKTWKKVLLIILCTLLALVIAVTATVFVLIQKGRGELFDVKLNLDLPDLSAIEAEVELEDGGRYIVYNGSKYRYNEDVTTMLFMGVDKRDIDDLTAEGMGGQSDVIVMMAIDTKNRNISMISLPRDTMADVAVYNTSGEYVGMREMQVCLAYAYGDGKDLSCEYMQAAVRRIFYNIPVQTYYALDLEGIAALNDSVGGVDVISPETIGDFVSGQLYHLVGRNAESFVRTRNQDIKEANLLRMERQKMYVKAFMSKVFAATKEDLTTPVTMFNESAPYSCTNLNASKVTYLAKELVLGGGMTTTMMTVPGDMTLVDHYAQYHIDEEAFYEMFLSVYYEKVT